MTGSTTPPRWRTELRAFVELFALAGLAVAQPLLDVFGRAPDHLVFRGAERFDVVVFGLLLILAVPVLLWLVELLVGLVREGARSHVHVASLWLLTAILGVIVTDQLLDRRLALVVGALLATVFVVLYRRTRGPAIWLTFLGPAPVVFLALFLFASPVAPLLRESARTIDAPVGDPTRTVVVVVDEFPLNHLLDEDGTIDAGIFPNLAALADTSTWFRQTTSVANTTDAAVPAMFTGILPAGRLAPSADVHPDNLFTLVSGDMPVVTSERVTRLCPATVCERITADAGGLRALLRDARTVLGQKLDPSDPDVDPLDTMIDDVADAGSGGDETPEWMGDGGAGRFGRFVDSIGDEAGLHMIHLVLPHGPYRMLPDGTTYPLEDRGVGRIIDRWFDDPAPVAVARQRQLLQSQRVDALLGGLRQRLEAAGFWDDTNVIVIADHGIAFAPGNAARGVRVDVLDGSERADLVLAEISWVPFLVKAAGQTTGAVSDHPVRNVDLLPTVADLLDVEIPWEHDGRSAFEGGSGDPDVTTMQINDLTTENEDVGPDRRVSRSDGWDLLLDDTVAAFAPADPPVDASVGDVTSARIFRIGPRPDLWGLPIPDGLRPLDVDIDDRSRADDVRLDSGELPASFLATAADVEVGTDVAITVNGTVWATTSVHLDEDRHFIAAILPREAFRDGSNDLAVYDLGLR